MIEWAGLSTGARGEPGDHEGGERGEPIIDGEEKPDPVGALRIEVGRRVGRSIVEVGDAGGGVNPHGEQREPGKELHHRKLAHLPRHAEQIVNDLRKRIVGLVALFQQSRDDHHQAEHHAAHGQNIEFFLKGHLRNHDRRDAADNKNEPAPAEISAVFIDKSRALNAARRHAGPDGRFRRLKRPRALRAYTLWLKIRST